jgi:cobalt/nickel transport system permease protein
MSGGHARHSLYVARDSVVHRLPAHVKLVVAFAFVLIVTLTPREHLWSFTAYGVMLGLVATAARIPPGIIASRMVVELPFVGFAVLMPFLSPGPDVTVLGLSLSQAGLWSAFNVLAKATLGVVTSILLAATTDLRAILAGLQRLRLPGLIVQIMTFMLRYADVVTEETRRMRIARESRGFVARDLRQAPVIAKSAGALFIRTYERGERVHLAMLARGYDGTMPALDAQPARVGEWLRATMLPLAAAVAALAYPVCALAARM